MISQEVLCDRAQLDRTYVSGIERGLRNPSLVVLWSIAKALDSKPSDLVALTERFMRRVKR